MAGAHDIGQIYRVHGHSVLRRACTLLNNDADAREIVQEVFVSLVERPQQFQGQSSIATWLYSATTHACLNHIRDRRTRARLIDQRVAPAMTSDLAPGGEVRAIVRDLLERLPEDLATVAVYYYIDEMTHDEIANLMGCSRRHVGNLLARVEGVVYEMEVA